jgi:hypothetical protein
MRLRTLMFFVAGAAVWFRWMVHVRDVWHVNAARAGSDFIGESLVAFFLMICFAIEMAYLIVSDRTQPTRDNLWVVSGDGTD